jgi:hypothetical protein
MKTARCLLALLPILAASATLGATTAVEKVGAIDGTVSAEVTQQPLEGVAISLENTDLSTSTDATGHFRIENVPIGEHRLHFSRESYLPTIVADVVVTAGRETQVSAALQESVRLKEDVTVRASYFAQPEGVTTGAYSMSYEEVRRAPGAVGDVGRMIQSLPAAVVRDDQRNDIVARGGSPSENLVLVDNIEVPNISHFGGQGASGGPVTMLNAQTISDVSFLAGGFPAAYGDRLSSVLDVSLREGRRDHVQAEFDLDMAGAGMLLEGPLGSKGSWLVSGRRSFLDLVAGAWNITSVPQYANYLGKAVYDVTPRNRLTFISLGGWDTISFDVDPNDLEDTSTSSFDNVGWRGVAGLTWRALLGENGVSMLSLSDSENSFKTDVRDSLLDNSLVERNRSRERETTIREDLTFRVGHLGSVRAGGFAKRLGGGYDYSAPLGEENYFSTDATRINALALKEDVVTWTGGGYLEARPRLGSWATASLGGRIDRYVLNNATKVSPRAGLTFHLRSNLDLSATYGRYYQNPTLILMRAFPDNAGLTPIRADHYVAGLTFRPAPDLQISVEGYAKRYSDYPVSTQFPSLTYADAGEQVDVSSYMMPYASQGQGRSTGVELHVHKRLSGRLWGQVSYAYSRTQNRALDGLWRPSTFDLPHVLSVIAGVKATRSLELSTKFTTTSGRPTTPLLPESYEQNRAIYDVIHVNSERAPSYQRLDLRLDRRESHRWGNLVFYLELDNVTNRKNVLFYDWNSKKRELSTEPQLTFMAIGGINVEF